MKRPKVEDFKVKYTKGIAEINSVIKQYSKAQDLYINYLEQSLLNSRYTPEGAAKGIDFERTIDLLDAEIDSLKDAYHKEPIAERKTQYSSMILESLHAKKKLKQ